MTALSFIFTFKGGDILKKFFCIFILSFYVFFMFFRPYVSEASFLPINGSNALKGIIISSLEKGGVKFGSKSAREKAIEKWNMEAYERMKADELAGRNSKEWEELQEFVRNPPQPEPIPEIPGYGRVLLSATLWGNIFLLGYDIGTAIYEAFSNQQEIAYLADKSILDMPSGYKFLYAYGLSVHTCEFGPGNCEAYNVFTADESEWAGGVFVDIGTVPDIYFQGATYYSGYIPNTPIYVENVLKIDFLWQGIRNGKPFEKNDIIFLDLNKPSQYNPYEGFAYKHIPTVEEVPEINIPKYLEPLTSREFDIGEVPNILPQEVPDTVEVIVPLSDPLADNPYVNPFPEENPNPEPEPSPDPDPNPGPNPNPNPDVPKTVPSDLERFKNLFTTKFPFSLPFDLYNIVQCLYADPIPPKIDFQINTKVLDIPWRFEIHQNLTYLDDYIPLIHTFIKISYSLFLIFATRNLLGGSK